MDNCAAMRYSAHRIVKEENTVAKIGFQPVAAIARKITIPEADLETFRCYTVKISLVRLPAPNWPSDDSDFLEKTHLNFQPVI
ncbi:MAG: hypothetical protein HW419_4698 [Deltaproteobacteria bacterium]|nr:hypothetical protein [Deltaproteobacteria bacterium]